MPDITVVKIKVRRGSDEQRKQIVLDQGELGYTIDTKRVFVGDGALSGGNVIGSKNFGVYNLESGLGTVQGAQIGDIGYANSKLYALTANTYDSSLSGWSYIGPATDEETIELNGSNQLSIKLSSIDANDLKNSAFGRGLIRNGEAIDINFSTDFFSISSSKLTITPSKITQTEIASTALGDGLSGGSGELISVDIADGLEFDSNGRLKTSLAASQTVTFSSFAPNTFSDGLIYNNTTNQIQGFLSSVNADNFEILNKRVSLIRQSLSGQYEMPRISLDDYGIVDGVASTFWDCLTATTLTGGDFVPVGAILPHAAAIANVPDGYLLCDGRLLTRTEYSELFDVIGTEYGTTNATNFRLPNLTGGNVLQYGSGESYSNTQTWFLSGDRGATGASLSAIATNYIIKHTSVVTGMFTGAPNQVTRGIQHSGTTYSATDSDGNALVLSSAGFLTLALSGNTRNNGDPFDRYAIPIFNY